MARKLAEFSWAEANERNYDKIHNSKSHFTSHIVCVRWIRINIVTLISVGDGFFLTLATSNSAIKIHIFIYSYSNPYP